MSKPVFQKRQFLNTESHGGTALINAIVNEAHLGDGWKHLSASIEIGDCSRRIELDFGVSQDEEGIANVRSKLSKLKRTILAFEAAFLEQLRLLEEASE